MNANYRKYLKFVALLATAILIGTASATIYDYMNLNATVGVQGMGLQWLPGSEQASAGTDIEGVTATLTQLKGPPNGTRKYSDPVRLNNTGVAAVSFNLTIFSLTGDTAQLDSLVVGIYSMNTSLLVDTLSIWSGGAQGSDLMNLQIPANNVWRLQWEITWKSTATPSHSITVNLKIQVPVA